MSTLSEHHRTLTNGVGKCSVPMWCGGMPAGFCDKPAYGNYIAGEEFRNGCGELQRFDGKYNGYVEHVLTHIRRRFPDFGRK